jgi:hypothetical protein
MIAVRASVFEPAALGFNVGSTVLTNSFEASEHSHCGPCPIPTFTIINHSLFGLPPPTRSIRAPQQQQHNGSGISQIQEDRLLQKASEVTTCFGHQQTQVSVTPLFWLVIGGNGTAHQSLAAVASSLMVSHYV